MAIMGFGGGALIASPLSRQLMDLYDPAYDPARPGSVPAGSAVALLFLTLGLVYLVFMMFGAFIVRVPADGWKPDGFDPSTVKAEGAGHDGRTCPRPTRSGRRSSGCCGSCCSATSPRASASSSRPRR